MCSSSSGGYCVSVYHRAVRVIDPAIPAQRKRQCLKFVLETIIYLTFFFRRALKKPKTRQKGSQLFEGPVCAEADSVNRQLAWQSPGERG